MANRTGWETRQRAAVLAAEAEQLTAVLLEDPVTPELMYRAADYLAPSLFDLLGWLGVED